MVRKQSVSFAGLFGLLLVAGLVTACGEKPASTEPAALRGAATQDEGTGAEETREAPKTIRIGVIAKSQSNPVFQAARTGAEAAGRELSAKYGVTIQVDWRTPNEEDAQRQADFIEQLANQGYDGIAISCSEANRVTPAINDAVDNKNVQVVCFDSDAPDSKRFAFHGVDDITCGGQVMELLAEEMGGKGQVAILAGNQTAPNLQKRAEGVRIKAAEYPEIEIVDTFYHKETPQDAAARVEQVMQANPEIDGWAMIGGWPLFTTDALKWEPGTVKVVAVDALPAQLGYLRSGHVQTLLAQQVFGWGHRSVELLVDRILFDRTPADVRDISELIPVTAENVDDFAENWKEWLP